MPNPNLVSRTLSRPGFLEAVVGLSVLMALSGVLMPVLSQQIGASHRLDAQSDLQAIAAGIASYAHDTRTLPTGAEGRTNVSWLYGPGNIPAGATFGRNGETRPLGDALLNASMGGKRWAGPYVTAGLHADPWGNAYLVDVGGFVSARQRAQVLSAGPNGRIETGPEAVRPSGDDLVLVVD